MNTKVILATLCALGIPAGAASAGDFYTGFGSGAYRLEVSEYKDTAPTAKLLGGYRFNEFFAMEAGYQRLFETEDSLGGNSVRIDGDNWELATILSYPFAQRWNAYSRLGWAYNELTAKSQGFGGPFSLRDYEDDFSWAIGSGYSLSDRLALRGEYGQIDVEGGDAEFLSLSLTYQVGK